MDRTTHPLAPWLGPALDDFTDEQLDQFTAEVALIDERYPDPDEQDERDAAMSAACQYILGETDLVAAALELAATRRKARHASVAAQQVAAMATRAGMPEAEAARAAGIDRMTLRKALGKR